MKKNILRITLFLLTLSAWGQNKVDCNQQRNEKPHFTQNIESKMDSLIALDLKIINSCYELDSIDHKILLNPQVLAVYIVQMTNENKEITYGSIFEYIEEFKATTQYQKARQGFEFMIKYENKTVDKADSLSVRRSFEQMEIKNTDLDDLLTIIYSENNSNLTYKEAFILFIESKEPKRTNRVENPDSSDFLFGHFKEIETLKQVKANTSSIKPKLFYFTGWADINGRKMEESLFQSKQISEFLNKYECYIGFADDRSKATIEQKSEFVNNDIQTKGQFISELEKSLFPKAHQPIILIVNQKFELVDSFGYSQDEQKFVEFLKKNKNVR